MGLLQGGSPGLPSPLKLAMRNLADQETASSTNFVQDYFSRSVLLFRDDENFMRELVHLVETDLSEEVKLQLVALYQEELLNDLPEKENSVILQKKCTLLYLLALLSSKDADLCRVMLD